MTGIFSAFVSARNVRAIRNGLGIMPTPAPRSAIDLAGQPMLISIISGFHFSTINAALRSRFGSSP
ncbi:MAG TPA: hypothetical protein PLM89_11620, partial [Anaerolineales bacterium]|nr:hypothetical protein [Anaerolineales bacterium]